MPRRYVTRAIFLLLCVAPTVAIAGWSVARLVDNGVRSRLEAFADRLSLRIDVARSATPRPGEIVVEGLVVRERESSAEIASLDALRVCVRGDEVLLSGGELRVDEDQLDAAAGLIDRINRGDLNRRVRCEFRQVAIRGASPTATASWRQVGVVLRPVDGDPALGRELLAKSQADGCRLEVIRNRQIDLPATRMMLATGESAIPWRLLHRRTPIDFSTEATFQGEVSIVHGEAAASGRLAGQLEGVSPASLLAGDTPPLRLDRPASIRVTDFDWRGERIERLAAQLRAGPGAAERDLVLGANQQLHCGAAAALNEAWLTTADGPIAFDELAVSIELDADGLRLRGGCRDASGQAMPCVLARGGAPLLFHPNDPSLPVMAALRFLAPPRAELRPAGPLADAVARRLPLEGDPARRR